MLDLVNLLFSAVRFVQVQTAHAAIGMQKQYQFYFVCCMHITRWTQPLPSAMRKLS